MLEDLWVHLGIEHFIQPGKQFVVPAMCCGQPGHVLGHVPRVLPSVAFGIVAAVATGRRVERLAEIAGAGACAHIARGRVEGMLPVAGTLGEFGGDVGLAELVGHARDGPVVEGVFQRLGCGFAFFVDGYIAQLAVLRDAVVWAVVGAGDHGLQGFIRIEARRCLSCKRRQLPGPRDNRSFTRFPGRGMPTPARCRRRFRDATPAAN